MKNLGKRIIGICMILLLVVGIMPGSVFAANMNLTVGTSDNAKAGDNVTVRLVVGNNPGISTFAAKVAYDSDYLTYTGAAWSNTVSSDTGNVQLISEVQENGKPALNISAILSKTYSSNETIATLNFTVKKEYTTMPITATVREVNDANFDPVTVTPVVDANAGKQSSQNSSQNNSENSSQNNSQSNSQNNDQENSQVSSTDNSKNENASVDKNTSDKKDSTKEKEKEKEKDKEQIDKTPKTGTVDLRLVFGTLIVVFLAVAGICIKVLGKKNRV